MIVELTVENIAVIERAQLSLGSGLTVLTGETGAGKSLLVDAIQLALGERADSDLVRAGASRATVSAVFDLSNAPDLRSYCEEAGLALEDQTLFVHREVFAEGRSQCRVGGKMAPVSALRVLGQLLVDLHGQHDHQSLLHNELHVGFLDGWIGAPATGLLAEVRRAFSDWEESKRRLNALVQGIRDRAQRLDLLRYQVEEIESVSPITGEMEELEMLLKRLSHTEKLKQLAFASLGRLNEQEACARDLLGESVRELEDAVRLDESIDPATEYLRQSLYALDEGIRLLRHYAEELETDAEAIERAAERIESLRRLRRKYGDDEGAILAFLEDAREQLSVLEDSETSEADLRQRVNATFSVLSDAASRLSELRSDRAIEFAKSVQDELQDLAMEKAKFSVRVEPKSVEADGADRVEFFFSANIGEPERALAKIASGGEMSRVMLAIKTVMAGRAGVPTLIFDEVDAGLSGRAAAVVGRKLEQLATHYQVLAISHLPQIASRAASHVRIEKTEIGGRVVTHLRTLSGDERVEELARMLAGETIGETALANARDMLNRE